MSVRPLAILKTGLMTPVGEDAASSCAAFRSKLANPTPTRFMDSTGEWILAHQVAMESKYRGLHKLARMALTALDEALEGVPRAEWSALPLLLCVAEKERPGRLEGLDDQLLDQIQSLAGARFSPLSAVIAQGRVGIAVAMAHARKLIGEGSARQVVIAGVDSLVSWPTLMQYDRMDRLLKAGNSNGFMPGEGAGALLVGEPSAKAGLLCTGMGFGREAAHIDSEAPLRAEGLSAAIRTALAEAGCALHDIDYRITDLSGEQYYFKEAALAVSRLMRQRKEEFDLWHPAECIGEAGALSGAAIVALADSACRKGYGKGERIVAHMSNDAGQRAALSMHYRGA